MNKYPIYIVSKGRWESRLTAKSLDKMNTPYYMVVEESEYDNYANVVGEAKVLILPQKYLDTYDTCDDLGDSLSKGPGAARNFSWDHSRANGDRRHWVMDDNLDDFYRFNRNLRIRCRSSSGFRYCEDFVDRYSNVPVSGLNYRMFCNSNASYPPFVKNTRIYSCLLIDSFSDYYWKGRYNEDTDLSLRVLKNNECTIQFNSFLCGKIGTQQMSGGNTDAFYAKDGTYNKSKMLEDMHPDVARVAWRFKRWHHYVDYSGFKDNKLIKIDPEKTYEKIDNYGMKLVDISI